MNSRQVLDVVILIRLEVKLVKLNKRNKESFAKMLIGGAVIAVLLSITGWLGKDIWLASTQWLLIAAVLTLFGIYLKIS